MSDREYLLDIMEHELLNDVPHSCSYFGPLKPITRKPMKKAVEVLWERMDVAVNGGNGEDESWSAAMLDCQNIAKAMQEVIDTGRRWSECTGVAEAIPHEERFKQHLQNLDQIVEAAK